MSLSPRIIGWGLILVLAIAFYPLLSTGMIGGKIGTIIVCAGLAIGFRLTAPTIESLAPAIALRLGWALGLAIIIPLIWVSTSAAISGRVDPTYGFMLSWIYLIIYYGSFAFLMAAILAFVPLKPGQIA